jgi:hypothetical protein
MKIYKIAQNTPDTQNTQNTPQTMYHGTTKDFEEFELGQEGHNSNALGSWKTTRNAIFFTPDKYHANAFTSKGDVSKGTIKEVYLNVQNPLNFKNGINDSILEEFETQGINPRWLSSFNWEHLDDENGEALVNAAIKLGYDAVIFNDENPSTGEEMETWAVFNPSQIRPAQ